MVTNHYVKCATCDSSFRLRAQIGFSNIPIHFNCPVCGTLITGEVIIPEEPDDSKNALGIQFKTNHTIDYEPKADLAEYLVELSTEFLQQKVVKDESFLILTPFMRSFSLYGEQGMNNINRLMKALKTLQKHKDELIIISELWNLNKIDLLMKKVNNFEITKKIINSWGKPKNYRISHILELLMVVHQSRIELLSPFFDEKRRNRILSHSSTYSIIENNVNIDKLIDYSKLLGLNNFFNDFEKRIHELTLDYIEILPDLLPLLNSIDQMRNEITSEKYTITTKYVKELTNFYAKTYELFCDKIDIIIGLNNLYVRGNIDKFCISDNRGYNIVINSFSSKYDKVSKLLCLFDSLSMPYIGLISNRIRNAEGHFSREFNIINNSIVFSDNHKGRNQVIEIDYLEFSNTTVNLFNALNEVFEVSYQFDKIYRVATEKI